MTRRDPSAEEFAAWRLTHPPIMGADDGAASTDGGTGDGAAAGSTDGGDAGDSGKTATGKTFTEDDVNRVVQERLIRERAKYADYDDLKTAAAKLREVEDAQKTEEEKTAEKLSSTEKRAVTAEAERDAALGRLLRYEVAAETGLDPKWAGRLTGSTREDLEKDAKSLLKELRPAAPATGFDGGAGRGDGRPPLDMNTAIRRAAGRT